MPVHNKCPLCGSADITVLHECTDSLVSGRKFPVRACKSCSFVFTDDYPAAEESHAYYQSKEYISHTDTNRGILNRLYHLVRSYMLSSKFRMIRRVSGLRKGTILDIGSGTGYFPLYMSNKEWKSTGIEISSEARDYAFSHNKISLLVPEAIEDMEAASMDVVTMWHTLEHFYDPGKYLESAYRILKSKGLLVVALPNHRSYDAAYYGASWAAWDVPRHLWHFNPETINHLVGKYNFKPVARYRLPFDAFYVSVLSEKNKGSHLPLIKGFIRGKLSWISSILDINRTSSLVYFFRKDQ